MPIFDQGYQHWNGPLAGHAWRWLAITRHGVRTQFANRWLRLLLLGSWVPALLLGGALALWGLLEQQSESVLPFLKQILPGALIDDPQSYRHAAWTLAFHYYYKVQLLFALLVVLLVGPNLISRDLRYNALPLYFSRPLRRFDYFAGKLGVLGFFLALVVVAPPLGAYVLGVCFSLDLTVIKHTYTLLGAIILYGLVIIASAGTLMLALSSLSRKSIYVSILWVGFWLVSMGVSELLVHVGQRQDIQEEFQRQMKQWVAEHPPPEGMPLVDGWRPERGGMRGMRFGPEAGWLGSWREAYMRAQGRAVVSVAHNNWRYLCSYLTNLYRIGDALFDANAAWSRLATITPRLDEHAAVASWHYPWTWSAGVLAALMGLSLWILTTRVRTMDRLK